MFEKICPILKAAGFVNGKEECDACCAWYVETDDHDGCALAILAAEQKHKSEQK